MSYRRHTNVRLEARPIKLEVSALLFSTLRGGLVVRLSAIALDLNGNICLLCLRWSAIRPRQTASDGRRPYGNQALLLS